METWTLRHRLGPGVYEEVAITPAQGHGLGAGQPLAYPSEHEGPRIEPDGTVVHLASAVPQLTP